MNTEDDMNRLFCVIPCYNEEEVLHETASRLEDKIKGLIAAGKIAEDSRILFVNDGSRDKTWSIISELHEKSELFQGINLSKNMGHQNALLAGLMTAKDLCDAAISLDADLQDDINAIDEMVDKFLNGADVVYGVRSKRATDTFFKKFTAESFYKLMNCLGANTVYNHADYRLMSRRALQALSEFGEVNLFLRGIVPMVGFNSDVVYYERAERFAGESKYPLRKMLSFAMEGITSLSTKPIKMITGLGVSIFLVSIIVLIYSLVRHFTGHTIPGWTTTVLSVWAIGGLIMISLGVIGEYIGKIYLETKNRPRFIIRDYIGDEEDVEIANYTYKR
jgi:glycosyltransferase involved in cell wall biosynthesis